jgi:hypothetical protein
VCKISGSRKKLLGATYGIAGISDERQKHVTRFMTVQIIDRCIAALLH